ncbi:NAD(P)/FAD-dependent oxidoreductase [Cyanothece sp. BG0011]|uniref:protoporphyrinogen/coproporphyrinogen oxidase n=1 Tax=Cyanothece sp. BG0011 TaxID=2082950 RepID=UPI000D1FAC3B|nr:NAD(P)-binding protein [Cyanothece sp. BG0011]
MEHLTILGAGFSGLSSAYHFSGKSTLYEKRDSFGGTASSMQWKDFVFDYGPHVSFTKDTYVKDLLAKAVDGEFFIKKALTGNYYQGHWVRHPAICNLCDLPPEVNRDALVSFIEAREANELPLKTYRDWCEQGQGKYFADHFTHLYTRKFWTVEPEKMTYQWAGERVARPGLKRVIDGSLGLQSDSGHYFTEFRYPKKGGYGAYSGFWKEAEERINLNLNHTITEIDLKKRILSFAQQPSVNFGDTLISSLPLPEFVRLVSDAPDAVKAAANQLQCTSIALVNIALQEPALLPYHWLYIYDEDIIVPRVTFYSNLSEFNAPPNCTAIQAEVPYGNSRPLPSENVVERVISDLEKCGILKKSAILHAWQVNVKYGYVIFDFQREAAVKVIHDWMKKHEVKPVGRFGLWQYLWSDQAIKSGKQLISSMIKV